MSEKQIAMASEISTLLANGKSPITLSGFDVLTLEQAAQYLQVSPESIKNEAERGFILGRQVDGNWRFLREDVIRWLRAKPGPIVRSTATWTPEQEAEIEAEIAAIYAQRRALGTVGDLQTLEEGE